MTSPAAPASTATALANCPSPSGAGPVLVTGPTGNVGRPLVARLLAAGVPVRLLATEPARALASFEHAAPPGRTTRGEAARPSEAACCLQALSAVRFDFADRSTHAAAFTGGGPLFLLRPPAIADVAGVMVPAIDAAVAAGVRRVVFLSIQGAPRNPWVPHRAIEQHLQRIGQARPDLAWTFLRAAYFMQNLAGVHAADIRERDRIVVPAGRGRTAFVDARDVAEAAAVVLREPGHARRAYTLTGSEALDYDEVAATLSRVLGRPIRYTRPGLLRFWRHMRAQGHPRAMVLVMCALYTGARLGLAARLEPDLARLLGRPPTRFERFAQDWRRVWMC